MCSGSQVCEHVGAGVCSGSQVCEHVGGWSMFRKSSM